MKPVFSMLAAAVLGLTPVVVAAQEPADGERVAIELNRLEQVEGACRIYLVVRNEGGAYESFKLDVVLFDAAGVIASRVAVTMAPLRAGRPSVQLFDVQDQDCAAIGSLLVNEVSNAGRCGGRLPRAGRGELAHRRRHPALDDAEISPARPPPTSRCSACSSRPTRSSRA